MPAAGTRLPTRGLHCPGWHDSRQGSRPPFQAREARPAKKKPEAPAAPPVAPPAAPPRSREAEGNGKGRKAEGRKGKGQGNGKAKGKGERKAKRQGPGRKRRGPAIKLAPLPPTSRSSQRRKAAEPAPQKPDIRLPLDAIRAGKAGTKPLSEHIRKHEQKRLAAEAAKTSPRKGPPTGKVPPVPGETARCRTGASAPRRPCRSGRQRGRGGRYARRPRAAAVETQEGRLRSAAQARGRGRGRPPRPCEDARTSAAPGPTRRRRGAKTWSLCCPARCEVSPRPSACPPATSWQNCSNWVP